MCTWKPGPRCACHAARKLARARAAYDPAHPSLARSPGRKPSPRWPRSSHSGGH